MKLYKTSLSFVRLNFFFSFLRAKFSNIEQFLLTQHLMMSAGLSEALAVVSVKIKTIQVELSQSIMN